VRVLRLSKTAGHTDVVFYTISAWCEPGTNASRWSKASRLALLSGFDNYYITADYSGL